MLYYSKLRITGQLIVDLVTRNTKLAFLATYYSIIIAKADLIVNQVFLPIFLSNF